MNELTLPKHIAGEERILYLVDMKISLLGATTHVATDRLRVFHGECCIFCCCFSRRPSRMLEPVALVISRGYCCLEADHPLHILRHSQKWSLPFDLFTTMASGYDLGTARTSHTDNETSLGNDIDFAASLLRRMRQMPQNGTVIGSKGKDGVNEQSNDTSNAALKADDGGKMSLNVGYTQHIRPVLDIGTSPIGKITPNSDCGAASCANAMVSIKKSEREIRLTNMMAENSYRAGRDRVEQAIFEARSAEAEEFRTWVALTRIEEKVRSLENQKVEAEAQAVEVRRSAHEVCDIGVVSKA